MSFPPMPFPSAKGTIQQDEFKASPAFKLCKRIEDKEQKKLSEQLAQSHQQCDESIVEGLTESGKQHDQALLEA